MNNQRKKFKPNENETKKNISFRDLPSEILFKIFDLISVRDIMSIRQISKEFKNFIDHAEHLWYRVLFNLEVSSNLNLDVLQEFLNTKTHLKNYRISCPRPITKSFMQLIEVKAPNFFLDHTETNVTAKQLNLLSMNCLYLFANNASKLRVESFVNTCGQIKSQRYKSYLNPAKLRIFKSLQSLDMSCLLYDLKENKFFVWDRVLNENEFFRNSSFLFENLKELRIRGLNLTRNLNLFYESIVSLNSLSILELEHSHFFGSNLYIIEKEMNDFIRSPKSKLSKIKSLLLVSSSVFLAYIIVKYFINLRYMHQLKLFLNEVKDLANSILSLDLTFVLSKYLKDVIVTLDEQSAPNFKVFSTNIFTNVLDRAVINELKNKIFQSKSLNELNINCHSEHDYFREDGSVELSKWWDTLYKLTRFRFSLSNINDLFFNCNSSSLKSISISFFLDCEKNRLEDIVNVVCSSFKDVKNLKNLRLNVTCFKHSGSKWGLNTTSSLIEKSDFFVLKQSIYCLMNK